MDDLVTAAPRRFPEIAPASWEHPADRAALQALRAIPAFDQVVKKLVGFFGERGVRMLFQGNAVRVGPAQFPVIDRAQQEVQATLDWQEDVPVFVSQQPWFNAGAYGVEHPFVVLHSSAVDVLDERGLRVLLGHELGHVMSGHSLYRTMLAILLAFGLNKLPFLTGFAILPIRLALLEWSRKSELSADRAALLSCQNVDDVINMLLRASAGTITQQQQLDLAAYKEQVRSYEVNDDVDAVFKLLNLLDQTHPFHTLRASHLLRWSESEEYRQILAGSYRRRSEAQTAQSYGDDLGDAASYYAGEVAQKAGELRDVAKAVAQRSAERAQKAARDAKRAVEEAVSKIQRPR